MPLFSHIKNRIPHDVAQIALVLYVIDSFILTQHVVDSTSSRLTVTKADAGEIICAHGVRESNPDDFMTK